MDIDIHPLSELAARLQFADIDDIDEHDLTALSNAVNHLDIVTGRIRRAKLERRSSVNQMATFIAQQVSPVENRKEQTMRKSATLPVGSSMPCGVVPVASVNCAPRSSG